MKFYASLADGFQLFMHYVFEHFFEHCVVYAFGR